MDQLYFKPVRHKHKNFLAKAAAREGFAEAYDALALEYQLANQMLKARPRAGLTPDAEAVGGELQVKRVPQKGG
jgi:hypothetical protein